MKNKTHICSYKQVIILRSDLKMSCGKAVAQACHAAVSSIEEARLMNSRWLHIWIKEGQKKIILKVETENALLELEEKAKKYKVPSSLVYDMGLTEIPQGTLTALGLGPAPSSIINIITGNLPLY